MVTIERLESILRACPRMTVALLGDLFLDRYLDIEPDGQEISVETGLEAYQVSRVRNAAGALGTVMNNLAGLGVGLLVPVTVIGDDGHGYDLRRCLGRLPSDCTHVVRHPDRLTPTYTKPMKRDDAGAWHELNRLDVRTRTPLDDETTVEVCHRLLEVFRTSDALIVLDQIGDPGGVVNEAVRQFVTRLADREPSKPVLIDSRRHLGLFTRGILKGNQIEALAAAGTQPPLGEGDSAEQLVAKALDELVRGTQRPAFCTLGERGIMVAQTGKGPTLVPGCPVSGPTDIVGAGDSATSGIVVSLLAGATAVEAAAVGNLVASITVQQVGTTGVATPEQVLSAKRRERQVEVE